MTLRAMQIGVSGLRAEGEALGVVGDNVANVSTTGFKRQRSTFEDVLNRSGSGDASGAGSRQEGVQQVFSQGTLALTGMATDVAITGDGFFVVSGSVNGLTGSFYSRAGEFRLDASGFLVNSAGLKLQGRAVRADGTISPDVSALRVPAGNIPAHATTNVGVVANLDASAQPPAQSFDPQAPADSANFSTSLQIFDSLGNSHELGVYFCKAGDGQWEYHALAKGDELNPPLTGSNVEVGSGTLTFTSDGALSAVTTSTPVSVSFASATPGQAVTLDFGSQLSNGGSGLDGTTQFGMPSGVSSQTQDGYASGALGGVRIDADGTVEGLYTNGQHIAAGQLVLAKFRSEDGLLRAGDGLWAASNESGEAALGQPGSGGRGMLSAGALEGSNVDLGEEFVAMIQHQRAYSADSKVIATADEMLSALMQLTR